MINTFLNSLLVSYSGAVMPGSLLTYTIDKSIKNGKSSGFLIIIGHCILEIFVVLLLLFGLGQYLAMDLSKIIIGLIGGCILCFLGTDALRGAVGNRLSIDINEQSNSKYGNLMVGGAVISSTNPYFTIWWVGVGLALIQEAYNSFGMAGVLFFYAGHIIGDISWYGFVSVLVAKTRAFISIKVYRWVVAALGVCLLGFGLSFIVSSVNILL